MDPGGSFVSDAGTAYPARRFHIHKCTDNTNTNTTIGRYHKVIFKCTGTKWYRNVIFSVSAFFAPAVLIQI